MSLDVNEELLLQISDTTGRAGGRCFGLLLFFFGLLLFFFWTSTFDTPPKKEHKTPSNSLIIYTKSLPLEKNKGR